MYFWERNLENIFFKKAILNIYFLKEQFLKIYFLREQFWRSLMKNNFYDALFITSQAFLIKTFIICL